MGSKKIRETILLPLKYLLWFFLIHIPRVYAGWELSVRKKIVELQIRIDPIPEKKRNETEFEWLKRIQLKHAVRYVNMMQLYSFRISQEDIENTLGMYKRKKDKKLLKDFFSVITQSDLKNQELYRFVMARKEAEEQLERAGYQ